MRLHTEQLNTHLARELRPLYVVFGDEPLLALEATDRIRAQALQSGYSEREVLSVDTGFKWSQLSMSAQSQSLFASQKLLELRLPSGKPGTEGAAALVSYCESLPSQTLTLVHLPALDWRAQKSAWFEALEQKGVCVEALPVTRKALPAWIEGRLKAQSQHAPPEVLHFMTEQVEGNLLAAFQEIHKLALLFPAGPINLEEARACVLDVARFDVFSLGIALVEGDPVRLTRMLEGLKAEGTAPPMVLWALSEEIRTIARLLVAAASGRPLSSLWRETRVWGVAHQDALKNNISRFRAPQVSAGLRHAAAIDQLIKGLAKGDLWDELQQLALGFARLRGLH